MFTLFRCSTLEDWTDVMYINMFGCDKYGYDGMLLELCKVHPLYFYLILDGHLLLKK